MRHSLPALLLALLAPAVSLAAGPVCALLDPDKTPRGALLEARLLAEPGTRWVERGDIDKVLKEQKLQAAFGPQGVADRITLGKILKADLLVLVRPVKGAESPALEVVVSETVGGLRLLVRAVPVTKKTDEEVASLLAAVRDGIKRHSEKITEVVAVPSFLSNDLEFTHDHLRGAFAKFVEAEALDRKGLVVVELEEAEALAKEIALAAPGATLNRQLPVYLFGEFRHDGKGKDTAVSLKLRAERGGKAVGKPEAVVGKPEEAPAAVRKWAAGVLDSLAKDGTPRPPADPKAEARTLAERAALFKRLGNWAECLALLEASLLLDPSQTDLHAEAIKAVNPLLSTLFNRICFTKADNKPADIERFARLFRRRLAHVDAFADKGGVFAKYLDRSGADALGVFQGSTLYSPGAETPKAFEALIRELKPAEDAVKARIQPILARQYEAWSSRRGAPPDELPAKPAWYDPNAKPDPAANRIRMTPVALTPPPPKPGALPAKRLLGVAAAGPGVDVVWSNYTVFLMTEKGKLRVAWEAPNQFTSLNTVRYDGKYVWCVASRVRGSYLLFVLDPASGKTCEVTAGDGLPEPTAEQVADFTLSPRLTLTTLGPGRACVAGWMRRAWVAVVAFDPGKNKAKVDVIHEARETSESGAKSQWASTTVAFRPSFMLTLRDAPGADGKAATRVLLGRAGTADLDVNLVPLVIDPDKPAVTVAPFRLSSLNYANEESWAGNLYAADGGVAYHADRLIYPRLLRVPFPGLTREVVGEGLPQHVSFLTFADGRAQIIQTWLGDYDPKNPGPYRGHHRVPVTVQWYTVEPGETRPKLVGVDLPLIEYVAVSSHYGLVAIVGPEKSGDPWTLQTVEIQEVAPKK